MLKANDYRVRTAAMSTLAEASVHRESQDYQYEVTNGRLKAKFCDAILCAIPSLVELLKAKDYRVRTTAMSALAEASTHRESQNYQYAVTNRCLKAKFSEAILTAIPSLVELFKADDYRVQTTAMSALAVVSAHRESQDIISITSLMDISKPSSAMTFSPPFHGLSSCSNLRITSFERQPN
jgi:hypothetical protein